MQLRLLSTAQVMPPGPLSPDLIFSILARDADFFQYCLTGSQSFAAATLSRADFDTELLSGSLLL